MPASWMSQPQALTRLASVTTHQLKENVMSHYHLTGIDRKGRLVIADVDAPTQQEALAQVFAGHDVPSLTCSKGHVVTQDCCSFKALADVADSGFGGL